MTLIITIAASLAALIGGAIALRFKDQLHIVLGFSAGAILGAALFDLIPEAVEIGEGLGAHPGDVLALTGLGFLIYLILDRFFLGHGHDDACGDEHTHEYQHEHEPGHELAAGGSALSSPLRGAFGAASLCVHSLIDGAVIGLAFQASATAGMVVAIAVIAHRFSDGINAISIIFKNGGTRRQAWGWLAGVAAAPLLGAASTVLFELPETVLGPLLAVFAGFFLYIGASDLIPEGHHSHSKIWSTAMTILGAAALFALVSLLHA